MSINPDSSSERQLRDAGTPMFEAQSAAQEQLRIRLAENPEYAALTIDPNGYITSWNHGAVLMKKYSADEAIGQHFSMLYTEEARKRGEPAKHLRWALAEGSYHEVGMRVRKGGHVFLADVQITPIYRAGTLIGFSKVVSDVTEQGQLKRERDESRAMTETLEIQKGMREKFVVALTHDLRNPLASIKAAAELQAKHPDDKSMRNNLNKIILNGVERMESMISTLLDANRIAAREKLPIYPEESDLLDLVNEVVRGLSVSSGNRFEIVAPGSLSGFWDRQALKRAIENLTTNAIKYGAPDRPVTITLREYPDQIEIDVHNFGNPIPPSLQESIFEQFRRAKSADEGKAKGWGLGLTLARGIAESHGGSLTLESSREKGTSFTMKIPREPPLLSARKELH